MKSICFFGRSAVVFCSLWSTAYADASCDNVTANLLDGTLQLTVKYLTVGNVAYDGLFDFQGNIAGKYVWKFSAARQSPSALPAGCLAQAGLTGNTLSLSKINTTDNSAHYAANFEVVPLNGDYYLALKDYTVLNPNTGANHAPVASPISQQANITLAYQEIALIATDADGDSLSYQLVSAQAGAGYKSAYINPLSPKLYVTLEPNYQGTLTFQYHVSDGKAFSDIATVTLAVNGAVAERSTGLNELPPADYAKLNFSSPNADLLGAPGAAPTLPKSIDLSENFPIPGNQGKQSSCVGWATAYALKSYQEKAEMGWALNTKEHLFSPSFIYNQINGGKDQGSQPTAALELIKQKGAATLATMPYDSTNYTQQPSAAALEEAAHFKALSWAAVPSVGAAKATLANRQPVTIGIQVYPQFLSLKGVDSVFNDYSGEKLGGHALTIVGYDDNKFGGAYKVINSWGTEWGDNGYFWLPYNSPVLLTALSLTDANNTNVPVKPDDTKPTPTGALPNFTVQDWHLDFDNRPGGLGQLQYKVVNVGSAPAQSGAYINLVLSKDSLFNNNDILVVYEQIPFDLQPGEYVYRDAANQIEFNFPANLAPGDYFIALWVDDQNSVVESNENDNVSIGENKVGFENSLPDLGVDDWWANWSANGDGNLVYTVRNNGLSTAAAGWYLSLVLSRDAIIGNGDEYTLVFDKIDFTIAPGNTAYRDEANPTFFNLFQDMDTGSAIPAGDYYLALWADDLNKIVESNEDNNFSLSSSLVPLRRSKKAEMPIMNAHNAKVLPNIMQMQKIRITKQANGRNEVAVLSKKSVPLAQLPKQIAAFDKAIFPTTQGYQMPVLNATKQ